MTTRALWIERRRLGLGGSDAAGVLGLSPWQGPIDVWLSKVKPEKAQADDEFLLELGVQLEPVIAGLYQKQTQRSLSAIPAPGVLVHEKHPVLLGTPDRIAMSTGTELSRVVELKSEHQFADKFGDPGTDQVPDHYLIQCAHYMAIANLDACDVAVLHGGHKFAIYQLRRDRVLEESMIGQLLDWWNSYVVPQVEPPIDATEKWADYLATKYPFNRGPLIEVTDQTDPELMRQIWNVFNLRKLEKQIKEKLTAAKNAVKGAIGENDGLRGEWGKITWRLCKDSTASIINYERIFDHLSKELKLSPDLCENLRLQFTESIVTKQGSRRLTPTLAKEFENVTAPGDELAYSDEEKNVRD